ncbi:MAG TPA: glycoside hydrolase family 15 protein [Acidimicrobiales bacterium]|nr:glycoside hydrolase family 15 protein [Acidimicrobiales bacterium]
MPPRIGDYALIGDCHTVALVSRDASIDWWCPRRFDAPSAFARILDPAAGHCAIRVDGLRSSSRSYVQDTNVLTTVLSSDDGDVEVTDCMPVANYDPENPAAVTTRHCILRRVRCLSGQVRVAVESVPRPDYGRGRAAALTASVDLSAGDSIWVRVDGETLATSTDVDGHEAANELVTTIAFWRDWLSHCSYRGAYEDVVRRSALVCKALIYAPTGAVVAAPTTSLPEWIGGERNWDYRYTWIRDATVTLIALRVLGYGAEADAFKGWLERTGQARPDQLQIMYGIGGETELPEVELDHLAGHRNSRPVRVGNGAATQSQHDSYGQLIEAAYLYVCSGGELSERNRRYLEQLAEVAAERWHTPDHGIWEIRAEPRRFVHSTLLCWVALARAVDLAETGHLRGDLARWTAERDACRQHLLETARRTGWFPQASGSEFEQAADAATLLVPAMGLLPANHEAVEQTVQRVRRDLSERGLLLRYRAQDGLEGGEGVFLLCSFWLVDVLTHQGRLAEAEELLERLIGLSNDLGLFAEETDAATGEALGNFPQAFTHMALITTCAHVTAAREGRIPPPDVAHDFAASAIDRLIAEGRC